MVLPPIGVLPPFGGLTPIETSKRSESPKPRGGLYTTEGGIEVSFPEDLEPGTAIKRARELEGAALLEKRAGCSTNVSEDDWDSETESCDMPLFEFVDDVIAYKME